MKETKCVCDHCGKKLDEMKDYIDVGEDIGIGSNINGDLCSDCYHELENIVIGFFQRKEFCEKEDKNKSGLLVGLPCKVGDLVYYIRNNLIYFSTINKIEILGNSIIFSMDDHYYGYNVSFGGTEFGKRIFFTVEEAEAKLEELKK